MEILIALNNVSSHQRLLDAVKVVLSSSNPCIKAFVVTRASGMAAQAGIPEATKQSYRAGKPLIVLPTLRDAVELLKPSKVLIHFESEDSVVFSEALITSENRVMFVADGSDGGYLRSDLGLGELVRFPGFRNQLPPSASIALFLLGISGRPRAQ